MGRKSKDRKQGYAPLLECWEKPADAGHPIGCLATTFTFSPLLFEEECLSRFLGMESDAHEDGPVYVIEREEKLRAIRCAAVLVDQNHCRGPRSLRWDLLSARVPRGIFHAKVSLLVWTNRIRILVGSANLTEPGYRDNREVFAALDFHPDCQASRACLDACLEFLSDAVGYSGIGDEAEGPKRRWMDLLGYCSELAAGWHLEGDGRGSLRVAPLFIRPAGDDLFRQFTSQWPESSPPYHAWVTSPFFNRDGEGLRPESRIWDHLRKRGAAKVTFNLIGEASEGDLVLHGPETLRTCAPSNRAEVEVELALLPDGEKDEKGTLVPRPLHAKSIWWDGNDWIGYLIGSSNFTRAGTGLIPGCNVEANLLFLASRKGDPDSIAKMEKAYQHGEPIRGGQSIRFLPADDVEDDAHGNIPLLPPAFGLALYAHSASKRPRVLLEIRDDAPSGWAISDPESRAAFYTEPEWIAEGRPNRAEVGWNGSRPPSGFAVNWTGSGGEAWWPVNIDAAESLPPPSELKDLPLDILIQVLTSARPLQEALRGYLKKGDKRDHAGQEHRDAHDKVDVSGFLLQRTRRASWALRALRVRLERPIPTGECLEWRLRGPVGALAVLEAIERECRSEAELLFLRAELCLELSQAKPATAAGCLSPETVMSGIREFIRTTMGTDAGDVQIGGVGDYILKVVARMAL
jgi:hypothetical protein